MLIKITYNKNYLHNVRFLAFANSFSIFKVMLASSPSKWVVARAVLLGGLYPLFKVLVKSLKYGESAATKGIPEQINHLISALSALLLFASSILSLL